MFTKKIVFVVCFAALVFALVGCAPTVEEATAAPPAPAEATMAAPAPDESTAACPAQAIQKLKVCMVLPGPITDQSWNALGKAALDQIGTELGTDTEYQDNVKPTDYIETYRAFASSGCNVVIGHGEEYLDTSFAVKDEFPEVLFVNPGGSKSAGGNMIAARTNEAYAAFVPGFIAGKMSQNHKVGIVGGLDFPGIIAQIESFRQGAEYADPLNKVTIVYIGTSEDVAKGKEAANALIAAGNDVLFHLADNAGVGVIEACREANIKCVGFGSDQTSLAPDNLLTSAATLPGNLYVAAVKLWQSCETIKPEVLMFGLDAPFPVIVRYDNLKLIPADIQAAAAEVEAKLKNGEIVPELITTR